MARNRQAKSVEMSLIGNFWRKALLNAKAARLHAAGAGERARRNPSCVCCFCLLLGASRQEKFGRGQIQLFCESPTTNNLQNQVLCSTDSGRAVGSLVELGSTWLGHHRGGGGEGGGLVGWVFLVLRCHLLTMFLFYFFVQTGSKFIKPSNF